MLHPSFKPTIWRYIQYTGDNVIIPGNNITILGLHLGSKLNINEHPFNLCSNSVKNLRWVLRFITLDIKRSYGKLLDKFIEVIYQIKEEKF